jgi:hypothetical protein
MWHRLSFQFSWFLVGVLFLKHDRSAKEVGRDYTINEKNTKSHQIGGKRWSDSSVFQGADQASKQVATWPDEEEKKKLKPRAIDLIAAWFWCTLAMGSMRKGERRASMRFRTMMQIGTKDLTI